MLFALGLALDQDLPYASCVAEITDVCHHCPACLVEIWSPNLLPGWLPILILIVSAS
jgi:hypothetical protein